MWRPFRPSFGLKDVVYVCESLVEFAKLLLLGTIGGRFSEACVRCGIGGLDDCAVYCEGGIDGASEAARVWRVDNDIGRTIVVWEACGDWKERWRIGRRRDLRGGDGVLVEAVANFIVTFVPRHDT